MQLALFSSDEPQEPDPLAEETHTEAKARVRRQKLAGVTPAQVEKPAETSRYVVPMEPLTFPDPGPCPRCGNVLCLVGVRDRGGDNKTTPYRYPVLEVWCKNRECRKREYRVGALARVLEAEWARRQNG